ncbi:MAG: hypothetical protein L6Q60_04515 [Rhodocyclaceae bacterium]|nr:hypothetical protein [Rhodocyclaceae bacterium]
MVRSGQKGYLLIGVVAALIAISLTLFITRARFALDAVGGQHARTKNSLSKVSESLVAFNTVNLRLPCPAKPNLTPGDLGYGKPSPDGAAENCDADAGVVPWKALGLRMEDASDEWGRLLSYRVFSGTTGLTQTGGGSAADCDTDNIETPETSRTANWLCSADHNTLAASFLTDKGRKVNDFGRDVGQVAFVLLSHGRSGLGGHNPDGNQVLPLPTSPQELANASAAPPEFWIRAFSTPGVSSTDAGHYDDLISYMTIPDLLVRSKLEARNWPENPATFSPSTTSNMDTPSLNPSNPHFMTSGDTGLGQGWTAAADPDLGGAGVAFGAATGAYSACLWWPIKFSLVTGSGSLRRALITYLEFSTALDDADRLGGFTLAYLSGSAAYGMPDNSICGTDVAATRTATGSAGAGVLTLSSTTGIASGMYVIGAGINPLTRVMGVTATQVFMTSMLASDFSGTVQFADTRRIQRDLGWAGGSLATNYANRFAIEFDAFSDTGHPGPPAVPTAQDPAKPHLSVDYQSVVHDSVSAAPCSVIGSGQQCDSRSADFPAVSTTALGTSGQASITVANVAGIVHGMTVSGAGIAAAAQVTGIVGNQVRLSLNNTSNVNGAVAFSALSTDQLMQSGTAVFHSIRSEVYPRSCLMKATSSGFLGTSSITVPDITAVQSGMAVYGNGVGKGAKVTGASGTTISLSVSNSAMVSGPVIFGAAATILTTGVGASGANTITVANPKGIAVGMGVAGMGIASGATVAAYSGSTITLSASNTSAVSDSITFTPAAPSVTLSALVKTWIFSNAGCNSDLATCAALKNVGAFFNEDVSTNTQLLHAVSCAPAPTAAVAYDSLYFGVTTATSSLVAVSGPVLYLRRLATAESSVLP